VLAKTKIPQNRHFLLTPASGSAQQTLAFRAFLNLSRHDAVVLHVERAGTPRYLALDWE